MLVKPHSNNGPYAIAAATFLLCVPHMVITPFVITSRGTGVSRWHPRCLSILSLFLSLSTNKGLRTSFAALSVTLLKIFFFLPFARHRLSLTKFSGTSPPVRRRNSEPDEEAAHTSHPGTLVSNPGCVLGVRTRAYLTRVRTHRSSSVLHPNVCQRPRNFAAFTRTLRVAQTRVPLYHTTNFALSSQITVKNRSMFSNGAREDASPPEKEQGFLPSRERPGYLFLGGSAVFCMTRAKI